MATKKSKSVEKIPYTEIKFVFNNLSKSQLDEFDSSEHSKIGLDDLDSWIDTMLSNGFRLSVRDDSYSGGLQITATCDLKGKSSAGYATSARSSSFVDAMRILRYKVAICADYDLSSFDNEHREVRG